MARSYIVSGIVISILLAAPFAFAEKDETAELKSIFPDAEVFVRKDAGTIGYYDVMEAGESVGYGVLVTADGYSGPIRMIVGIGTDGVIKRIVILKHQETAGFGARINEIKPGEKEPFFLKRFIGKPAGEVKVGRNIDAVSGATISSVVVTDAVRENVGRFLEKLKGSDPFNHKLQLEQQQHVCQ